MKTSIDNSFNLIENIFSNQDRFACSSWSSLRSACSSYSKSNRQSLTSHDLVTNGHHHVSPLPSQAPIQRSRLFDHQSCMSIDEANFEITGLESATSSSLICGLILIVIMLLSLSAFVCSKIVDPCEDFFLTDLMDCSNLASAYFSLVNIYSCLYSFLIYFLHLVGQCDYISWSARRKVTLEILLTLFLITLLLSSILFLIFRTAAPYQTVSLTAITFSAIAILFYALRVIMLLREVRMLWDKPKSPVSQSI